MRRNSSHGAPMQVRRRRSAHGPHISFSGSIAEGATTGRAVGTATLANPPVDIGTLTWSELGTGTGAALFAIDGSTGAATNTAALDYETASSYTYGIQVTDGVYTYTSLATITVTNVLEVTLSALSLSSYSWTPGTPASGSISGAQSGEVITLGSGWPSGLTINSGARTWAYDGTGTDSTGTGSLIGTHADGNNSPRTTSGLAWTLSAVTGPALTSPSGAAEGAVAATLGVTTDTGDGVLYWFVSTSATVPGATLLDQIANLKAGTGAAFYGNQPVSATGAQSVVPHGLTAATTYYTYFLQTDAAAQDSAISSASSFTTGAAPTAKIIIGLGDSTGVGIGAREGGDTAFTDTYNWRTRATAGISTSLPYDQAIAPDGTSYLSHLEYSAKRYTELFAGKKVMVVPHCYNGSKIVGASNTWGVGQVLHEDAITRANAAIAAWVAANPSDVLEFEISVSEGSNDQASDVDAFETAWIAAIADIRSRVFKNGVSGATIGKSAVAMFRGTLPQQLGLTRNYIEQRIRKMMYNVPNARYWKQPENQSADGIHPTNAGQRLDGAGCENAVYDTAAPAFTFPSTISIYADQLMEREIVTDKVAWFTLSGADAASFEIAIIPELNTAGNVASSRDHYYLRGAGGAVIAAGTYDITINAWGNGGVSQHPVAITSEAAYGTTAATIAPQAGSGGWETAHLTDAAGRRYFPTVKLFRGVTACLLNWGGGATDTTSCVASNGLVGVKDTTVSAANGQVYYFYSAQDEEVTLYFVTTGPGPIADAGVNSVGAEGTARTPSDVKMLNWQFGSCVSPSLTVPGGGIGMGIGICTGGYTPPSGATNIYASGNTHGSKRTTTGQLGATETGTGSCLAVAFAAA